MGKHTEKAADHALRGEAREETVFPNLLLKPSSLWYFMAETKYPLLKSAP